MGQLKNHKSVKAYYQHGFIPVKDNETQIIGTCPFCLRENKFYVNKESKKWDCKVCGKSGGFQKFLQEMDSFCQDNFKGKKAVDLSKSKGLKIRTLKEFNIGFNPITCNFTIPHYDFKKENLNDLRIFTGDKILSTFSCKPDIFNSQDLQKDNPVYICEGEWDLFSLYECEKNESISLISVSGANSFNINFLELFRRKKINILFDNDKAGIEGSIRVFNLLNSVSESVKFLQWGGNDKKGKDVRDLYSEKGGELLDYINKNLSDKPKNIEVDKKEKIEFSDKRVDKRDVYKVFDKWLYLPDKSVIDVLIGAIIANRMQGDQIWLFLVAPPGMTKSELLQTTKSSPLIESISKLTPKALVSGFTSGGYDPSLLPKLDGKTLIIKDFTTVFGMPVQNREEIFSTLRDAYDGNFTGVYGHGERKYNSKFGIIAGVTPILENYMSNESAVGERFLRYNMYVPDSLKEQLKYMEKANGNNDNEGEMKTELNNIVLDCLKYNFPEVVIIPDRVQQKIYYLSIWVAKMRASVSRDRFSKEIINKPFAELGTRLSKQLTKLLIGICKFKGLKKPGQAELNTIKKIARNTVPRKTIDFIKCLVELEKDRFTKKDISDSFGLSTSECGRIAENLVLMGMLNQEKISGLKTEYCFSEMFDILISESGVFDK